VAQNDNNKMWRYDGAWNAIGWTPNFPRHSTLVSNSKNTFWAYGGEDSSGTPLKDTYTCNTTTKSCAAGKDMPSSNQEIGAAHVTNKGLSYYVEAHVINGGRDADGKASNKTYWYYVSKTKPPPVKVTVKSTTTLFDDKSAGFSLLDFNRAAFAAVSKDGTVGAFNRSVTKQSLDYKIELNFHEVLQGGTPTSKVVHSSTTNYPENNSFTGAMAYDGTTAHLFLQDNKDFLHYFKKVGEAWLKATATKTPKDVIGDLTQIKVMDAQKTDKNIRVTYHSYGTKSVLINATVKSGSLTDFNVYSKVDSGGVGDADDILGVGYNTKGSPQWLYRKGWDLNLATTSGSGVKGETVVKQKGNGHLAAYSGSLTLDFNEKIYVASGDQQTGSQGSPIKMALTIKHRDTVGKWQDMVNFNVSSGYEGGDGNKFTGQQPHIVAHKGYVLVVFTDVAAWHKGGEALWTYGNLRLAIHDGKTWHTQTIYSQKGQKASPKPLYELLHPRILLPPKDCTVSAAKLGWDIAVVGVVRTSYSDKPATDSKTSNSNKLLLLTVEIPALR